MSITDKDMRKLKISVINIFDVIQLFFHVDKVSEAVQNAIRMAEGYWIL